MTNENYKDEGRRKLESYRAKYEARSYAARQHAQEIEETSEAKYQKQQKEIIEDWTETRKKIAVDLARKLRDISEGKI